jgi:hypothetical protein
MVSLSGCKDGGHNIVAHVSYKIEDRRMRHLRQRPSRVSVEGLTSTICAILCFNGCEGGGVVQGLHCCAKVVVGGRQFVEEYAYGTSLQSSKDTLDEKEVS